MQEYVDPVFLQVDANNSMFCEIVLRDINSLLQLFECPLIVLVLCFVFMIMCAVLM